MHVLLVRFAAARSDKRRLARAPFLPRSEQDGDAAGRSLWLPPVTRGWPLFAGFAVFSSSPQCFCAVDCSLGALVETWPED